ncbi:PadR-like family transcriptional regulator [Lapidilactobacillus concavus DSM 17758]|uniref:PadR-like family transcriptional regulator n=1 Tax=Lapidilactobacillus concavus DSM 17758 TaxID=1423735 RepID=A0A0R1W7D3_9LACO|nr:PadR family transcriptional regulator [Lapidilactobacillus concavus]KRM13729.1 PadR-like family transcriptional regulator [Lapidilactobacillus concavus DSM 17758]GEL12609.1 PadR family transcriptional regulator [Lapidilactobacillus concavus]
MIITTELLKGVLEGIVLQRISIGETYGYEITKDLNRVGFEDVAEGTVYTILIRLEKQSLVTVTRKKSSLGPMRKFYQLNDAGRQRLENFWQQWQFLASVMTTIKEDDHA